jgi:hypothetical protein
MSLEILKELSETDYQSWKRHPISQVFFEFLMDKSKDYVEGVMERWRAGNLTLAEDHEFRHRIAICMELRDLKIEDIKNHYRLLGKLVDDTNKA